MEKVRKFSKMIISIAFFYFQDDLHDYDSEEWCSSDELSTDEELDYREPFDGEEIDVSIFN